MRRFRSAARASRPGLYHASCQRGERVTSRVSHRVPQHEAPVGRDVVGDLSGVLDSKVRVREKGRCRRRRKGRRGRHLDRRQRGALDVEQFLAVPAPTRLAAAVRRHLPLPVAGRKRPRSGLRRNRRRYRSGQLADRLRQSSADSQGWRGRTYRRLSLRIRLLGAKLRIRS